ncbi:MAG: hypothetical protein GDA53_00640 [Rhodobacteraceae bacterium]|nr:hypothetical protein [Paracoccaceae bacterium]
MRFSKSVTSAAVPAIMVVGLGVGQAAAGGVAVVTVPDWTGGIVSCQLLANVLEREAGYRVNRVTIPSGAATLEAMAGGDIDVGCELWPSYVGAKKKYFTEWGGDGSLVLLGENGLIGKSSYYVPRYLVQGTGAPAPGLRAFSDLARYTGLFSSLETGDRGRLIGCPVANWECADQQRADDYGVPFDAVMLGSEAAHWAEMQGAYKRGEAFVAYAWEPHWIHVELDLVALELDDYGDGSAWPKSGWAVEPMLNYASREWVEANPEAADIIRRSTLTNEQQNAMIYDIDIKGRDLNEVVDEWMAANEDVWKAWLN